VSVLTTIRLRADGGAYRTAVPDRRAPQCPNCHSVYTERLPFLKDDNQSALYSCNQCGHVWREPKRKPADDKREKIA
jgi:DNA-directed RNA polymerase subunit M/transcription elongation factor TFIIS